MVTRAVPRDPFTFARFRVFSGLKNVPAKEKLRSLTSASKITSGPELTGRGPIALFVIGAVEWVGGRGTGG